MMRSAMRVLLAIDGSAPAAQAIDLAAGVRWPDGTTVRVVEAVETGAELFGGPWPALALVQSEELEAELRAEADTTVREAAARLARAGLTVETAVLTGRPATAVVDAARTMHADLVALGSRGHGTIEAMLLGSVSAEVIDHSPAPVLVARAGGFARVVLAWDGSSGAARAADLVRTWPIFAAVSVRVVSVSDVGVAWRTGFADFENVDLMPLYTEAAEASRREHEELAREMAAQLGTAGRSAEADVREGDAAAEILAAAKDAEADVIVIGTHGRTGLARLLLGSVARNVLHHAACSVLVVREPPSVTGGAADRNM
jgi:nucleotide-binding universal stress UspA family protein